MVLERPANLNRGGVPLLPLPRLAGAFQHALPDVALGVHDLALADGQRYRQVDEAAVPDADDHAGAAGHGGMDGGVGEPQAENRIGRAGRNAADEVARVDVFDGAGEMDLFEVGGDVGAQEGADVLKFHVAGGVRLAGVALEQFLPGALGDHDDGVFAAIEALVETIEEAVFAFHHDRHFGDQHKVDVAHGQRRKTGDEAAMAAHEFDEADAVVGALGFLVGGADGRGGGGVGGLKTKRLVEEHDVVVDGLGDADEGDLEAALVDFIGNGQAAAERAVAADDEQDVDGRG